MEEILTKITKITAWIIPTVLLLAIVLPQAVRILREYERAVVFLLGRLWKVKGPGLVIIVPVLQQMVRVDLRTRVLDVPPTSRDELTAFLGETLSPPARSSV